ncbi:MAG: DUF1127 domain-containing protein [Alphaproteobacteria bacterium]
MFWMKLVEMITRWHEKHELHRQLWAMDERQLQDIGITRSEIDAVVRGTRQRSDAPTLRKAA